MFKFLFTLIVISALAYFGLGFLGYEVHPKNFSYYLPQKQEVPDSGGNAFTQYLDNVKFQNKIHPLIAKKKGMSGAESADKGTMDVMRALTQADKFDQMKKLKAQIDDIKAKAVERNKLVEEAEGVSAKKPS